MDAGAPMGVLASTTITFTATTSSAIIVNQPRVNAAKATLESTVNGPSVGLDVPMVDFVLIRMSVPALMDLRAPDARQVGVK